jgi:hypothetical protein
MRYIALAAALAIIVSGMALVEMKLASLDGISWELGE